MKKSIGGVILKWVLIVVAVLWVKDVMMDFLSPKQTDLTALVKAKKTELEISLGEMSDNPNMVNKIYQYSSGVVTVDTDKDGEVGIVYIDGIQKGLHIHGKHYFMYGVHIGDLETEAYRNITFPYTDNWHVLNDLVNGSSTAYFYTNKANNDCMVVVINDVSGRVVAMTYFNDLKKISEQLIGG